MSAPGLEAMPSGASLALTPQKAFVLTLGPSATAKLPIAPTGKPHEVAAETYAGFATIADVSEPGLYQVTLSGVAWIDVIQGGVVLPAQSHTGAKDCPETRKSVRFELVSGKATLQLSSVPSATIRFAIRRAE